MKEIITSIRRTPYQSMAGFLVLFFTLFLSTAIFVTICFLTGLLGYVETRPQVTVYFQNKTTQDDIFKVRDELSASGKYAKKPAYLPEIAEYLKKQPGVDEVNFQKDIVERLLTLTSIVRLTSLVFFVFLLLMSIVVLTTAILYKIALKKDEIELLRLLGATSFYIKKPFLFEGILFGLIASLMSFGIIAGAIYSLRPFLFSYLRGINYLSLPIANYQLQLWPLSPVFLGVTFVLSALFGITIAILATLLATAKYLK
ncbi:hypothetical protein HY214_00285 [Candidatus Roizmanbacteria bacterium]|nr:hypothetical protein [Candidatus Roizmanbacteria bacterium]